MSDEPTTLEGFRERTEGTNAEWRQLAEQQPEISRLVDLLCEGNDMVLRFAGEYEELAQKHSETLAELASCQARAEKAEAASVHLTQELKRVNERAIKLHRRAQVAEGRTDDSRVSVLLKRIERQRQQLNDLQLGISRESSRANSHWPIREVLHRENRELREQNDLLFAQTARDACEVAELKKKLELEEIWYPAFEVEEREKRQVIDELRFLLSLSCSLGALTEEQAPTPGQIISYMERHGWTINYEVGNDRGWRSRNGKHVLQSLFRNKGRFDVKFDSTMQKFFTDVARYESDVRKEFVSPLAILLAMRAMEGEEEAQ